MWCLVVLDYFVFSLELSENVIPRDWPSAFSKSNSQDNSRESTLPAEASSRLSSPAGCVALGSSVFCSAGSQDAFLWPNKLRIPSTKHANIRLSCSISIDASPTQATLIPSKIAPDSGAKGSSRRNSMQLFFVLLLSGTKGVPDQAAKPRLLPLGFVVLQRFNPPLSGRASACGRGDSPP